MSLPTLPRRRFTAVVVLTSALSLLSSPAYAGHGKGGGGGSSGSGSAAPTAYDISYPQCGKAFPTGATLGIVGVNDGIVYSANPCLGSGDGPSELAWANATGTPAFYANTGDPGPAYSSHWPAAGTTVDGQTCAGDNSAACSWVYGYLAAKDSFQRAVTAEQQLGAADPNGAAATAGWWLDVETGNSWQTLESAYGQTATAKQNDTAALQGAARALTDAGVGTPAGFYSTGYQWSQITGGSLTTGTAFAANPDWVAGFSSATSATNGCSSSDSFTGGPVQLTQYVTNGYDADHRC